MNRLTIRNSDGSVSQPTDLRWDIALERLAAYEDIGLTPEQIRRYKFLISDTGFAIKAMRKDRGWTLEELGARLGVTAVSVGRFESGARKVSIGGLIRIAEIFEGTKAVAANEQDAQTQSQRLAAYENTGLTPDVCAEYKKFEDEAISKNVPFSRFVELMNADAEARVVVLPCNVGDTVYATFGNEVEERQVIEFDVVGCKSSGLIVRAILVADQQLAISARWDVSVGKYIFLTREEAEAALKGAKDGRC